MILIGIKYLKIELIFIWKPHLVLCKSGFQGTEMIDVLRNLCNVS